MIYARQGLIGDFQYKNEPLDLLKGKGNTIDYKHSMHLPLKGSEG